MRALPRRKLDDSVVYIESDSAPRILFSGEDLLLEDFPVGTRVIYPRQPIEGLPNPRAAIHHALSHPEQMDPLHALLEQGSKVTIALDDISLPLPPMVTPDIRQTMLEILLEMLDAHGIDDVHLIIATGIHRKMSRAEMRRMVGRKIFDAFYPDRYYNHDAEDPDGIVTLGETDHGEVVRFSRRAAESDLLIYVNINLTPMDGGHKSVATGLVDYQTLRAHHEPQTIRDSMSYMDPRPEKSELANKINRQGRLIHEHVKIFHLETALNNRMFKGQLDFFHKNEDDFTELDRLKFEGMRWATSKLPKRVKREVFAKVPASFELIACHAGACEPTHDKILQRNFDQYAVRVRGQADILVIGVPPICPYSVNSILNPLLVQVMGLGYLFNFYRGKPLLKKGGVLILAHPCHVDFDHEQHPSYIEFFHRLLPETRDAFTLRSKSEEEFAHNPSYIEMFRRGIAYHPTHPFFMWYWGENGRQQVGKVIAAGAKNAHVPALLGWDRADTVAEALAMAKSEVGPSPEITLLHLPPIVIADVE